MFSIMEYQEIYIILIGGYLYIFIQHFCFLLKKYTYLAFSLIKRMSINKILKENYFPNKKIFLITEFK